MNNNNSEQDKSHANDSTKGKKKGHNDVISKKPIKKTQVKLKSQENATTESNGECQHPHANNSECKNDIELPSETDNPQHSALLLNSTTPELVDM